MTNIAQAPGKCFSPSLALQYATMLKCCNGLSFAGGNIKDKHCFRVWRFEWQHVGLKKTFCQILFFFSRNHEWNRFLHSKESFHNRARHSLSCFCSYFNLWFQNTYEFIFTTIVYGDCGRYS